MKTRSLPGRPATPVLVALAALLPCILLPAATATAEGKAAAAAPKPNAAAPAPAPGAPKSPPPSQEDLSLAAKILRNADFLVACERGDVPKVKKYLADGIDPNAARTSGASALSYAVQGHYLELVRVLLAAGADPNRRSFGFVPLMFAAENGDIDIVRALLAAGADVKARIAAVDQELKVRNGDTVLISAAAPTGKAAVVKALVAAGADVNAKADNGKTALMQAVASENAEVARALVDARADVTARMPPPEDIDALSLAVGKGRADLVTLLVNVGADPEVKLDGEVTLLEFAVLSGDEKVAAVLRKAGAREPTAARIAELRALAAE